MNKGCCLDVVKTCQKDKAVFIWGKKHTRDFSQPGNPKVVPINGLLQCKISIKINKATSYNLKLYRTLKRDKNKLLKKVNILNQAY